VVEGVVVDIILGALVVEVDLFLTVELARALVLNMGRHDLAADLLELSDGAIESTDSGVNIILSVIDNSSLLLEFKVPRPVGVVTS